MWGGQEEEEGHVTMQLSLIHESHQILPHLKANEVCDSLQFGLPPFHDVAFVTNTNTENKGLYTGR